MTRGLAIAAHLRTHAVGLTYVDEDDLQHALQGVLLDAFPDATAREHVLSDGRSRIDFLIRPDVGIEVKIKGSLADVTRQLDRYATCPEIHELILITTRATHHRIPRELGARRIPVHLVSLIENGL